MQSGAWRSAFFSAISKRLGVGADLALVDDRLLVLEDELDRVLERQDVAGHAARCGSRASTASVVDLPEPVAPTIRIRPRFSMIDFLQHLRQAERVERRDAARDVADHDRRRAVLAEGAEAEAADALERDRRCSAPSRPRIPRSGARSAPRRGAAARCSAVITAWLTGMAMPLILMLIGAPTDRNMSDAFFSAISWNSRFIADIVAPLRTLRLQR